MQLLTLLLMRSVEFTGSEQREGGGESLQYREDCTASSALPHLRDHDQEGTRPFPAPLEIVHGGKCLDIMYYRDQYVLAWKKS